MSLILATFVNSSNKTPASICGYTVFTGISSLCKLYMSLHFARFFNGLKRVISARNSKYSNSTGNNFCSLTHAIKVTVKRVGLRHRRNESGRGVVVASGDTFKSFLCAAQEANLYFMCVNLQAHGLIIVVECC